MIGRPASCRSTLQHMKDSSGMRPLSHRRLSERVRNPNTSSRRVGRKAVKRRNVTHTPRQTGFASSSPRKSGYKRHGSIPQQGISRRSGVPSPSRMRREPCERLGIFYQSLENPLILNANSRRTADVRTETYVQLCVYQPFERDGGNATLRLSNASTFKAEVFKVLFFFSLSKWSLDAAGAVNWI